MTPFRDSFTVTNRILLPIRFNVSIMSISVIYVSSHSLVKKHLLGIFFVSSLVIAIKDEIEPRQCGSVVESMNQEVTV